jgi:predicted RNA-binding protein YlxR (DUF448 family)
MEVTRSSPTRPPKARTRTCVGCSQPAAPEALVRLLLGPESDGAVPVVVDVAGGAFGRGAHVHPHPDCLAKAERGLSRSFRGRIHAPAAELALQIHGALARRAQSLLGTAQRLRKLEVGTDAALAAWSEGRAARLVLACDAGSIAQSREVRAAVDGGKALAWSTRAELGAWLGKSEVALMAMTDDRLAQALAEAIHTMTLLSSPVPSGSAAHAARAREPEATLQQAEGEACKSPEVR